MLRLPPAAQAACTRAPGLHPRPPRPACCARRRGWGRPVVRQPSASGGVGDGGSNGDGNGAGGSGQAGGAGGGTIAAASATAAQERASLTRRRLLQGASALAGALALPPGPPAGADPAAPALTAEAMAPPTAATPAALEAAAAQSAAPAPLTTAPRGGGWAALRDPTIHRGLATSAATRERFALAGLLPPAVTAPSAEVARAAAALDRAAAVAAAAAASCARGGGGQVDADGGGGGAAERAAAAARLLQYSMLMGLRESDEATFYTLMQQDVLRYLPLIYTPTVGDACLGWGSLLPRPTCLTVSLADAGRVARLVDNWAAGQPQASIAVITDGERILGLGDLGAHGAGIPVGKAAVYGTAAYGMAALYGMAPEGDEYDGGAGGGAAGGGDGDVSGVLTAAVAAARSVVPVVLDVGCDTPAVVNDPLYVGCRRARERGAEYYALVDETVEALRARYGPRLLIHWEDVGASHAYDLLQRLESRNIPTFNDDIEATAAVTVAALLGAERLGPGVPQLQAQRYLFFGAGQANTGVASLLCAELRSRGLSEEEAAGRMWMVDRRGLVTTDRQDLTAAKARFAKPRPPGLAADASGGSEQLAAVVAAVRPTALIGAAAVGGAFTPAVLSALLQAQTGPSSRPLVFALSNPTSAAECSFEEARRWTRDRAIFASGTQFPPLPPPSRGGPALVPAQANNCLVFPGLGGGCVAAGAARVSDRMLLAAARAVAGLTTPADLAAECVLPRVSRLAECAAAVAVAVADAAAADAEAEAAGAALCGGVLLLGAGAAAGGGGGGGAGGGELALSDCLRRLAEQQRQG